MVGEDNTRTKPRSIISRGARRIRHEIEWCRQWPYWRSQFQKHHGRRGFVIGNGPSLRAEDLDRLKGEISIASNKIYLIYKRTGWRPSYHTMIDPIVIGKIGREVGDHVLETHVPYHFAQMVSGCRVRTYVVNGLIDRSPEDGVLFSPDMRLGTWCGYTVTLDNLQMAVHLGLNPIYLIGCDHYYAGENNIVANQPVASVACNHFDPNYRSPGELVNPAPIELMTNGYRHAAAFAEKAGIKIYNATRGGYLETFPRADFDKLF